MKPRHIILCFAIILAFSFPLQSTKVNQADLEATHIVTGAVESVEGFYGVTEEGDELIYSRVALKVDKYLKGKDGSRISFVVEGGEVGDIGLKVSESPVFVKGEKIKARLKKVDSEFELLDTEVLRGVRAPGATGCCSTFAAWTAAGHYSINPANSDLDAGPTVTEVTAGADLWNKATGKTVLAYSGTTSLAATKYDGTSVIFFRQSKKGSTIAVTYTWYNTRTKAISEFDMLFYAGAWKFFASSCVGGFYLKVIATHELGHAIGINHNNCTSSIMYPYANYCTTALLSSDDVTCAKNLYSGF